MEKHKKDEVQKLLDQLFVVEEDTKASLLEHFEELEEKRQKEILYILEKAITKQNQFLEQALKNNPNLITDIKHGVGEEIKKIRKKEEQENRKEELDILQSLENDLLSL